MADITKCTDGRCPSRKTCYRAQAESSERQSYADFGREPDADKCDDYQPVE